MPKSLLPLNPPRTTLHPVRAAFYLLLRTALWTSLILAAGLYCAKEGAFSGFNRPPAEKKYFKSPASPPAPARNAAPAAAAPARTAATDPLSLIKPAEAPVTAARPGARRAAAVIPRMKPMAFGGSGGNFAPLAADTAANSVAARPAPAVNRGGRAQEGVFLSRAALSKKIRLKGSAPVSAAAEKRYTGADKEAEKLRAALRGRAEAAEAEAKRLRREQLWAAGWIILAAFVIMLITSRIIKAWRLLEKPEGKHWTLK